MGSCSATSSCSCLAFSTSFSRDPIILATVSQECDPEVEALIVNVQGNRIEREEGISKTLQKPTAPDITRVEIADEEIAE